eukprot:CAMPEP_0194389620 /NCGR_PEP_ID=MMETSP0174-20130528/105050_1 /TAXON_ID=216777 /ORGANISM="Proboscia alata, Strain PI-D3" /LENGTH=240 /DNA_ID=CAMNT_0039182041 /DNA_START=51 /DNA_END=770 /DNA_ORIENTATION=+
MTKPIVASLLISVSIIVCSCSAFLSPATPLPGNFLKNERTTTLSRTARFEQAVDTPEAGYVPKWKKKLTLAEEAELASGGKKLGNTDVGLIGNVEVIFKQGNQTKTTMALVGQPISDVATQADQFIKYGCGKGECGTCQALCNGKWIKPCVEVVPADIPVGEAYVIQVKDTKARATSSGKFFSIKSFFMGFYNNLLGMIGFFRTRKSANKNFDDRMDYESMLDQKIREKKEARVRAAAEA